MSLSLLSAVAKAPSWDCFWCIFMQLWKLSVHLLLLDACHCRTPLNCEWGVNIIISLASGSPDKHFAATLRHTEMMHFTLRRESQGESPIDFFVKVIFCIAMKTTLCANFFKLGIKCLNLCPNQRLHTPMSLGQQRYFRIATPEQDFNSFNSFQTYFNSSLSSTSSFQWVFGGVFCNSLGVCVFWWTVAREIIWLGKTMDGV